MLLFAANPELYSFEKTWPLGNLPAGVYTLRVEAIDHERNEAFDAVTIYVGMDAPVDPDSTGGDPGTGDADSGDSEDSDDPDASSAGDSGDDDGDDGTDSGRLDDDPEGCACSTNGATTPFASLLFVSLVLMGSSPRPRECCSRSRARRAAGATSRRAAG